VDADATLVLAHSDHKQGAAGTYKHTFGFAPLLAYLDRGAAPGEPLAGLLRPATPPPAPATTWSSWSTSRWRSCPLPLASSRSWCEATVPGPAPGWPGTRVSAAWASL
jgi:hypothetical protein